MVRVSNRGVPREAVAYTAGQILLQRFHVGDHVFNLRRFQNILERRHQLVAIFDPGFQAVVGDFISVYAERAALRNPFQSRADFLLIAGVVMADGAFLLKQRFPARHRCRVRAGRFLSRILREKRAALPGRRKSVPPKFLSRCDSRFPQSLANFVPGPLFSLFCGRISTAPRQKGQVVFLHR